MSPRPWPGWALPSSDQPGEAHRVTQPCRGTLSAPQPAWAPNSFLPPSNSASPIRQPPSSQGPSEQRACLPGDSLVVALPELQGPRVGHDEDGTAQQGVEGRGEERREQSLNEQHGRVWARVKEMANTSDPPSPPHHPSPLPTHPQTPIPGPDPLCTSPPRQWAVGRVRGTAKGWAKAWKAEPQVICQGAM